MGARKTWRKAGSVVAAGVALCVLAADSRALVNYSNHPDLAQAMRFDPELNGGDRTKADRAQAERYYLRYLQDVNDSFQKARVYCQLGALYAVSFTREKGEEPNYTKARDFYRKVLEVEPERIGRPTMVARSMLVGLDHPAGMERIKAEMEFYTWLASWNEAKIRSLWLPQWKPGTRGPVVPLGVGDANEAFASKLRAMLKEEEEPSEEDVRGTLNALADNKEVSILNAATDATYLDMAEEGFRYIREHLPPDAPEREALNKIVRRYTQRIVDEAAQEVLNSFFPMLHPGIAGLQDANAGGARPADVAGMAPGATVRRRFIPHIKSAAQERTPFVLHLSSGAKVGGGEPNATDEAHIYESLAKAKDGDLAWDGRFLTTQRARLFSARQEAARPLKYSSASFGGTYQLPKDVQPPYALLASDREGTHYLIKVFRILPDGVDLFYRPLAPQEVPAYLPAPAEK
jgi:hypothetical protein